eukprot:jgi/Chlat1/4786/Chrsp31S04776
MTDDNTASTPESIIIEPAASHHDHSYHAVRSTSSEQASTSGSDHAHDMQDDMQDDNEKPGFIAGFIGSILTHGATPIEEALPRKQQEDAHITHLQHLHGNVRSEPNLLYAGDGLEASSAAARPAVSDSEVVVPGQLIHSQSAFYGHLDYLPTAQTLPPASSTTKRLGSETTVDGSQSYFQEASMLSSESAWDIKPSALADAPSQQHKKRYQPRIKLEVLTQSEVDFLGLLLLFSLAAGWVLAIIAVTLSHSHLKSHDGHTRKGSVVIAVAWAWILFTVNLLMLVSYSFRIYRLKREDRVCAQIWVLWLMASFVLCQDLPATIIIVKDGWRMTDASRTLDRVFAPLCIAVYYFYWQVMVNIASYRLMSLENFSRRRFYAIKILVCGSYYIVRVVLSITLEFGSASVPIIYCVPALRVLASGDMKPGDWKAAMSVLFIALFDICIILGVLSSTRHTARHLKELAFCKYRQKLLASRFFIWHTLVLWALCVSTGVFTLALLPLEEYQDSHGRYRNFSGPSYALLGLYVISVTWLFTQGHVHLPADSHHKGLAGWVRSNPDWSLSTDMLAIPSYSMRERDTSDDSISNGRPHFALETSVLAYNASLLAYRDSKQISQLLHDAAEQHGPLHAFSLVGHVVDTFTDTNVYIFASEQKILVSFRGTSSFGTLKTDLQFLLTKLDNSFRHLRAKPRGKGKDRRETVCSECNHGGGLVCKVAKSTRKLQMRRKNVAGDLSSKPIAESVVENYDVESGLSVEEEEMLTQAAEHAHWAHGGSHKGHNHTIAELSLRLRKLDVLNTGAETLDFTGTTVDSQWGNAGDDSDGTRSDSVPAGESLSSSSGIPSNTYAAVAQQLWGSLKERAKGQTVNKVHRGFYHAWRHVARKVVSIVQRERLKTDLPRSLLVTGHSLGGALAMICAHDVREYLQIPREEIQVYTFGAPRVGNLAFAHHYDDLLPYTFRVVVTQDVVTKVPMSLFGFRHCGKLALFDGNNHNLLLEPSWAELAILHKIPFGKAENHLLRHYRQAMVGWRNKAHRREDWVMPFWDRSSSNVSEEKEQCNVTSDAIQWLGSIKQRVREAPSSSIKYLRNIKWFPGLKPQAALAQAAAAANSQEPV